MTIRAHLPRFLAIALVTLVLTCSLGAMAWAVADDPVPDPCADVPPWASLGDCNATQSPAPTQTSSPQPSASPQPSSTATGPGSSSASARPTPTATSTPSTPAENWASDASKGIPTLTDAVQKAYSEQTGMANNYWTIYSVMFGFGMLIFAVMLLISAAKASKGGPRARAEFYDSLPKFFFWVPIMALVPAAVSWVYVQLAQPIEQVIGGETTDAVTQVIGATNKYFFQDPMALMNLIGGAIVAFFLFLGTVVVLIVWLIEHEVAKFGVYLLTVLIPISAALSLSQKWARMGARTVAAVIGCMMVPIMTKLAFWVAWAAMGDALRAGDNFLMGLLTILVIFSLATSAPIMLSYLAPNLLPNGGTAYGNSGGSARGHSQQAMDHAGNALSRLTNGFKGKGMSPGTAAEGAGAAGRAAGAGAAAEAGGAAMAAGGAVLGPLAAAAMAIGAAHDAVESASRSAAGEQLGAATGGHTSHAGGSSMPMPSQFGRAGGGGASAGGGTGRPSSVPSSSNATVTSDAAGADGTGGTFDAGGGAPSSPLGGGTFDAGGGSVFAGASDAPIPAQSVFDVGPPQASLFAPAAVPNSPVPSGAPDFVAAAPIESGPSLFSSPSVDVGGPAGSSAPLTADQVGLVGMPQFIPAPAQEPRLRAPRDSRAAPTPPAPAPAPATTPPPRRRSAARWPFGRRSR